MAFTATITKVVRVDLTINVEALYEWPERSFSQARAYNIHNGAYGIHWSDGGVAKRAALKAFVLGEGQALKLAVDSADDLDNLIGDVQNVA